MSVADGQLRNLLRLKFMAGEKDTKPGRAEGVEKEENKSKATPNTIKNRKGFLVYWRKHTLGQQHHVSHAGWDVSKR